MEGRKKAITLAALLAASSVGCNPQEILPWTLLPARLVNPTSHVRITTGQTYQIAASQPLRYDFYQSLDAPRPLPLVIVIHGGGWHFGEREDAGAFAYDIAAQGYAAASIDYRLVDGAAVTFPQPVIDVLAAIRFFREHAAELNINPDRIGLLGISAGAHLALLAGLAADDSVFDPTLPKGETAGVKLIVDLFAPTDFTLGPDNASQFQVDFLEDFVGNLADPLTPIDPALLAMISPINYVRPDAPPTLVIHGQADTLIPISQSESLVQAMISAGEPVEFHAIPGMDHLPGAYWPGPFAQTYRVYINDFLASHL